MKYLKRFNEELAPETYFNAAKKLKKMGNNPSLKTRADELNSWGRKTEWKNAVNEYSKYGTYNITIKTDNGTVTGPFHLDITFNAEGFEDEYKYEVDNGNTNIDCTFAFFVGLIPSTEELFDECVEIVEDPDQGNGMFWGFIFSLDFNVDGTSFEFKKFNIENYDESVTGDVIIADRQSANKFKNTMFKIFTDRDLNYPSGYRNHDYMYDLINSYVFIQCGISSDYGISMEYVGKYIKSINTNLLLK